MQICSPGYHFGEAFATEVTYQRAAGGGGTAEPLARAAVVAEFRRDIAKLVRLPFPADCVSHLFFRGRTDGTDGCGFIEFYQIDQ
ncbi:hypothetical protein EVAR_12904_1 [Eumeta japonica]|uniref:Uncharacterized protein n=1 Tax=Eumeta variegata TaxID=151549 RepID=A0A4C1TVQ5_EUMVA|nr:hypothetical protein EVAR_12904_1 [Eumeta japonica]